MGLNVSKLKELQKGLTERASGGGDKLFLQSNKIGEETNVRLLPPLPRMNGIYYVDQEGWWINGKYYLSNSTPMLKGKDVIQQEVDDAKALKDKDLDALISAKKDGKPLLKKEYRSLMPLLLLDVKYDEDDQVESVIVVDDKAKVLVAKPSLMREINRVVTSRPVQNKTEDGIMDREKGHNMILSRTGTGLDTTYNATHSFICEMPEDYYKDIPDVMKLTEDMAKSDTYLRGVIRNYLYGEEMPADEKKEAEKKDEAPKGREVKVGGGTKKAEPVAEKKEVVKAKPKVVVAKPRNVLEDAGATGEDDDKFSDLND